MSTDKNNGLGEYLLAELRGQMSSLNLWKDLQRQIELRGITAPLADETVWEKTIEVEPKKSAMFDKIEYIRPEIPPSLFGW